LHGAKLRIEFYLHEKKQQTRFANVKITIPGTRGFHHFIPENESMISARTVSSDNENFSF
jgi:hypothetical protein